MSSRLSESGQTTALVLVGLVLLAIPMGFAVAQGLSTTPADQRSVPTVTPPSLGSPTPTETSKATAPPTATSTPTPTPTTTPPPDGDGNGTEGNRSTGDTLFVNDGGGSGGDLTSGERCTNTEYLTIQRAVDAANPGDTVAVCPGEYTEHVEVTTPNLTLTASGSDLSGARDTTIRNPNESAVWINASDVTLQGFNISVGLDAHYAIEVGGSEAIIRGNTVESRGIGIFLSDGHRETGECRVDGGRKRCDQHPPVNTALGAAPRGYVLNNTVSADHFRIWVDSEGTVVENNFVTDLITADDAGRAAHDKRRNQFDPGRFNDSIVSSGNNTVIKGNTVQQTEEGQRSYVEAGILIGKTPRRNHNMATNNLVVNNSIKKPGGWAIKARRAVTSGIIVRNNTPVDTYFGIEIRAGGVIRNNSINGTEDSSNHLDANAIRTSGPSSHIINNTVSGFSESIAPSGPGNVTVKGNHVTSIGQGIDLKVCGHPNASVRIVNNVLSGGTEGVAMYDNSTCADRKTYILNNTITDNKRYGIEVGWKESAQLSRVEVHGNLLKNNADLGIKSTNDSIIVDATNNIWGCGGPSSGFNPLADPYTGEVANGSGDAISAGNGSTRNGHPISNVHFDPYKVQNSPSCLESQQTPTPTPTSTPSSPGGGERATPKQTATRSSGRAGGSESGNGSGSATDKRGKHNTGGPSGQRTSPNTATGPLETPNATLTPSKTPTATPTSSSPTVSPTPAVEPGFSVLTWLVALLLAIGLLALSRREATDE